jgi:alkylated DNA repair dioxygenase AlkB
VAEAPSQGDLFSGGLSAACAGTAFQPIDLPGADLRLFPSPELGATPAQLFERLQAELDWRQEDIRLFGKTYRQPRLLAWYGDPAAVYRYSGRRHDPLPWHPLLADLCRRLSTLCDTPFNSVLANLYRNERDSMGLHADDERELGPRPVIASLSLGATRVFRLRHRHRRDLPSLRLPLESGSLLVMAGDTQDNWKHEVPRERQPCGPRINLTFRRVLGSAD